MTAPRVAVVGSINTDYVMRVPRFPAPGETLGGESFAIYGGGKGANQALAARRMGASVRMIGAVGSDQESLQRRQDLAQDGIDVSQVKILDGFGGIALIQVETSRGQNQIVTFAGANARVVSRELAGALSGWCEPGCLVCCQLEIPIPSVERGLLLARENGALTLLNAAPFDPHATALLPLVDHLVVNEIEAGQFLDAQPVSLEEVGAAAMGLRGKGPSMVVITLGQYGAWLASDEFNGRFVAPSVPVVDSTGAGDAFVGAYAAALVVGNSPQDAVRMAVAAGSLAVQQHGAQASLPTRAAVEEALSQASR